MSGLLLSLVGCFFPFCKEKPLRRTQNVGSIASLLTRFAMPTPERQSGQLEPITKKVLVKQDETATKVERVSAPVRQLTVIVANELATQSNNTI